MVVQSGTVENTFGDSCGTVRKKLIWRPVELVDTKTKLKGEFLDLIIETEAWNKWSCCSASAGCMTSSTSQLKKWRFVGRRLALFVECAPHAWGLSPCCRDPGFDFHLWPFAVWHPPLSVPVFLSLFSDLSNKTWGEKRWWFVSVVFAAASPSACPQHSF